MLLQMEYIAFSNKDSSFIYLAKHYRHLYFANEINRKYSQSNKSKSTFTFSDIMVQSVPQSYLHAPLVSQKKKKK